MMMLKRRRSTRLHRRRAFTLMELSVTATIAVVFAAMIGQTIVSSTILTNRTLRTTTAEGELRDTIDVVQRFLRGARPLATCLSPAGSITSSACEEISETGPAFTYASATEIRFYAYTCSNQVTAGVVPTCAGAGTETLAPDLVVVKASPLAGDPPAGASRNSLTVTVYPGTGNYTAPNMSDYLITTKPALIGVGRVEAAGLFRFYADDRTEIDPTTLKDGPAFDSARSKIALVEVNLTSLMPKQPGELTNPGVQISTIVGIASRQYGGTQ